jgi:cytochrome c553
MRWGRAALALGLAAGIAAGAAAVAWRGDPIAATARLVSIPFGISPPDLDDPARISRGARHYAQFCAGCHAYPGAPSRAVGRSLRPPAPVLHRRIGNWPDELLFTTVRDGVPNSGMPAWPAPAREDEVWDMVAFLRLLPRLDPAAYSALTGAEDDSGVAGPIRACVRCHGDKGEGRDGIPRLDIQSPHYLADALRAFRDGERASGVMQIAAQGLDDEVIEGLAREFGVMVRPDPPPGRDAPPEVVTAGAPERKVPPCIACHGTSEPVRPGFPALRGQDGRYLVLQLELFTKLPQRRGGGRYRQLMQIAAHGLLPDEIIRAAGWYAAEPLPEPAAASR